jgi:hypothetical protein
MAVGMINGMSAMHGDALYALFRNFEWKDVMNDFKKLALVAAIIAGLAVIGSLMNSQQSTVRAAAGPTVTIDPTQLPLLVQGSLGVSGAVTATQSGSWNVGLTGTPNVKVANPATAPVLALNVNDPGRIAYQSSMFGCGGGTTNTSCEIDFKSVPAGHMLVVQHVSLYIQPTGTPSLANVFVQPSDFRFPVSSFVIPEPNGGNAIALDQSVLVYVDAGAFLMINFGVPGATGIGPFTGAAITGYMLDCTIAPCAAIAP